jgi:hypothetical protein
MAEIVAKRLCGLFFDNAAFLSVVNDRRGIDAEGAR